MKRIPTAVLPISIARGPTKDIWSINAATASLPGSLSAADKAKLDTLSVAVQTNATASRALNTTYTNSGTTSLLVMAYVRCAVTLAGGNAYTQAKSDTATPPTTIATGLVGIQAGLLGEDNSFQMTFIVAAGKTYRIDSSATNGTTTLGAWFESPI